MNIIVAVDKNWAIGKDNKLLVAIPADMKNVSSGDNRKVIVLGRKTLETFPGGLPLKNRTNIILTTNKDFKVKDATVVHSIEELLEEIKKISVRSGLLCGWRQRIQTASYCDTAHVTKIDFGYEADRYFPNLDESPEWEITARSEEQTYFDLEYEFVKYERVK